MECPICENKEFKKLPLIQEVSRYTKITHNLFKCQNCELVMPYPKPYEDKEKLKIYDSPDNIKFFNKKLNDLDYNSKEYKYYFKHFRPFIDLIRKYKIKGKSLDIGCGGGHLLKLLSENNFKAEGIEITDKLVKALNKKYKVYLAELGDKKLKQKYDLLTASQVIEHISDPNKFVQEMNKLLKKKGYVIISTPYLNGLVPKILRTKWYGLGYGQHLNFFSPKNLEILFKKNGFEILEFKILIVDYSHPKFPRILNLITESISKIIVSIGMGDNLFMVARKIRNIKELQK